MPVQFTSIIDEHMAVRNSCGVFDISHMGEVFVAGEKSFDWLQSLLANDLGKCPVGSGQYTFLLNERGGVIDDLIVYRLGDLEFLLLVNASKIEEDFAWLREHLAVDVALDNRSDAMSALALQGPRSAEIFKSAFKQPMPERNAIVRFGEILVTGTGYTGETGCELFFPNEKAAEIWNTLLAAGAKPCGLGARDTLRLEMCYPLNGSDLSPDRTPLEAGLGMFVAMEKTHFIGKNALLKQKENGLTMKIAAIRMTEKSPPPRAHYPIWIDGVKVGETTSGALSPSLNQGIAMAYLPVEFTRPGQALKIDIRGNQFAAVVEKKPFYRPSLQPAA